MYSTIGPVSTTRDAVSLRKGRFPLDSLRQNILKLWTILKHPDWSNYHITTVNPAVNPQRAYGLTAENFRSSPVEVVQSLATLLRSKREWRIPCPTEGERGCYFCRFPAVNVIESNRKNYGILQSIVRFNVGSISFREFHGTKRTSIYILGFFWKFHKEISDFMCSLYKYYIISSNLWIWWPRKSMGCCDWQIGRIKCNKKHHPLWWNGVSCNDLQRI